MRVDGWESSTQLQQLRFMFFGLRLTDVFSQGRPAAAPAAFNAAKRYYAADAKASPTEVSSILEQRIRGVQEEASLAETGRVLSVGYVATMRNNLHRPSIPYNDDGSWNWVLTCIYNSDGIARVHGMANVQAEELVE